MYIRVECAPPTHTRCSPCDQPPFWDKEVAVGEGRVSPLEHSRDLTKISQSQA